MKKICLAAALVLGLAVPAVAQEKTKTFNVTSRADCVANFNRADADRNGTLSKVEQDAAADTIPTTLANRDMIAKQTYLDACYQFVTQRQGG